MAFVHSLVRTEANGKIGWCAPVELGESAPHYVSFIIPVNNRREFFPEYACETIVAVGHDKQRVLHPLLPQGKDSFLLRLGGTEVWFTIRPIAKAERCLPYLGTLQHPDFAFLLTEIEAEDHKILDKLYDEQNTYVIGCDPFSHYAGIKALVKSH